MGHAARVTGARRIQRKNSKFELAPAQIAVTLQMNLPSHTQPMAGPTSKIRGPIA